MAIFSFIAEVSGTHRLEMSLPDQTLPPVQYEVNIEALRPATPADRLRVAAERNELEGDLVADADATLEGQLKKIAKYDASLALWRELGDRKNELRLLRSLGAIYRPLGELQKTMAYHDQAIQIARELGDRYQEANLTLSFGHTLRSQGYTQKAFDAYEQARQIFAGLSARLGEAIAVENIGGIYLSIGEPRTAIEYYNRALPTYVSVGEPFGQSNVLNSLGVAHSHLGEKQQAIELHLRALENARKRGIVALEAASLGNLGSVYLALGDRQKAADFFNQELALCRRTGNRGCMGSALNSLGDVSFLAGEKEKALEYYGQSLDLFRTAGERKREANALYGLARTNYSIGNLDEARKQIEAALDIRESLRANLARQDLRASFFGSVQSGFDLYINLLMALHQRQPAAGYDAAALQASERARARGLLEQLAETNADIRQGVDPQLLERERALQQQLNAKAAARASAFNKKETEALAKSFDKEIAELTTRYREVEARIRATSPRYAALTLPEPLAAAEIQRQILDENTVLLEFALGENRGWLWAVAPDAISSHPLPARNEIETSARKVYELLTARQQKKGETEIELGARVAEADAKFPQAAGALSRMLLAPVAAKLEQEWKGKRLVIVAGGALEYLPFGALPLPSEKGDAQPLIAEHEVVNLPSASVLSAIRRETAGREAATKMVAVLADPVFEANDPRVMLATKRKNNGPVIAAHVRSAAEPGPPDSESPLLTVSMGRSLDRGKLSRLPFSREEAEAIASLVPAKSLLRATDFQANRASALSSELADYRIVHFATHGLLNSEHPELSGLVLSLVDETGKTQDGFLRMHEIYNMRLSAETVVLSACQTALGKEVKGEGLVGLTRGFMYAGAPRVVASLWQVDDLATAELMKRFYRGMLKDGLRPAAALRAAQLDLRNQRRWASPYFWAAFVLQGEWR